MHGNSSCRLESLENVQYLLTNNITLFCFDFSGCGWSQGEYISLGWYERDDVAMIVEHLRLERRVSTIALWGRSMGAVTALLHADRDPSIAGIVLDSPFSDLSKLANELAYRYSKLPGFLLSPVLKMVSSSIKSRADFDIYKLSPINHVKNSFIPALFATATNDDFIQPHHSEELHQAYEGEKNMVTFDGDHNSTRPEFWYNSASIFLTQALKVEQVLCSDKNKYTVMEMADRKKAIRDEKKKKAAIKKLKEEYKKPLKRDEAPICKNGDQGVIIDLDGDEGELD